MNNFTSKQITDNMIVNLKKIKEKKPLIHHLTNYVTANDQANITLAIGGSPIMAEHPGEFKEIFAQIDCLLLNLGTINENRAKIILKAAKIATENNIPIVLDPVGVAISKYRLNLTRRLLSSNKITVIKGNQAEIGAMTGLSIKARGIDALDVFNNQIKKAASILAEEKQITVVVTGKEDYLTAGAQLITIKNGHQLMKRVTGTGCMAGSLIASFLAVGKNSLLAASFGLLSLNLAGELAAAKASRPGLFHYNLIDEIYGLNENKIRKMTSNSVEKKDYKNFP